MPSCPDLFHIELANFFLNVAELVGGSLDRTRAEKDLAFNDYILFLVPDDLGGEHRLWLATEPVDEYLLRTRHCFRPCSL